MILETKRPGVNRSLFVRKFLFGVAIALFLVLPFFLDPYFLHILIMTFLFAYLARSWDLIGGYAGQFFLGPVAMFGIGAYTSTLLNVHFALPPWIGMIVGGFLGTLVGVLLCYVSFRFGLKGIYFGLVTLTFPEICRVLVTNLNVFGGVNGILIPFQERSALGALLYMQFDGKLPYYYLAFLLMLLSLYVMHCIQKSRSGYYYLALRENEEAAEAVGVDTLRYKLLVTGIGCFFLAIGGTFHAQYLMMVNPESFFGIGFTLEVIIRSIVGGVGTLFGPIIGSFILTPLSDLSRAFLGGYRGVHLMLFGAIIVAIIIFLPQGVGEWLGRGYSFIERRFGNRMAVSTKEDRDEPIKNK
jgi:branched-chain amino acid transport system permease protein